MLVRELTNNIVRKTAHLRAASVAEWRASRRNQCRDALDPAPSKPNPELPRLMGKCQPLRGSMRQNLVAGSRPHLCDSRLPGSATATERRTAVKDAPECDSAKTRQSDPGPAVADDCQFISGAKPG